MSQRIQRKRTKGWEMPPNTVYVGRPSKWGNPFRVVFYNGLWRVTNPEIHFYLTLISEDQAKNTAVSLFERYLGRYQYFDLDDSRCLYRYGIRGQGYHLVQKIDELRGKDLACWCPLDQPCHADVLLEMLNKMDL